MHSAYLLLVGPLQAVPWATAVGSDDADSGGPVIPAVFEWAAARGWLLAAGGTTPCVVHTWDLQQEKKHSRVRHRRTGLEPGVQQENEHC